MDKHHRLRFGGKSPYSWFNDQDRKRVGMGNSDDNKNVQCLAFEKFVWMLKRFGLVRENGK
jgi:hypothetical protein